MRSHLLVFAKALSAPLAVYLVNLATLAVYRAFPNYDIVMHTLGGVAFACGWTVVRRAYAPELKPWMVFLSTVSVVALAAVLWEFHEYLLDSWGIESAGLRNQLSLRDTMGDLLFGLVGAVVVGFAALFEKKA